MKTLPLMVLACGSFACVAQEKTSPRFIEFVPQFTNSVSDMPYAIELKNDRVIDDDYAYVTHRDPLKQSYYKVGLVTRIYSKTKTRTRLSLEMGFVKDQYNGSMTYTWYKPGPNGFERTITDSEKSDGYRFSLKFGLSQWYNLNEKGSLTLAPEVFLGFDGAGVKSETAIDAYTVNGELPFHSADQWRAGGQVDVKLNYRLSSHFGVGLTLRNVVALYDVRSSEVRGSESREWNHVEFSIGKVQLPQLALIWYMGKKTP